MKSRSITCNAPRISDTTSAHRALRATHHACITSWRITCNAKSDITSAHRALRATHHAYPISLRLTAHYVKRTTRDYSISAISGNRETARNSQKAHQCNRNRSIQTRRHPAMNTVHRRSIESFQELKIEFTLTQRKVAIKCINILASMYPLTCGLNHARLIKTLYASSIQLVTLICI